MSRTVFRKGCKILETSRPESSYGRGSSPSTVTP